MIAYIKCSYHQAKHELPKTAYPHLIELIDSSDVELIKDKSSRTIYTSNTSLNTFHQDINDVIWDTKYDALLKSEQFGLIIHESTDVGNKKQLLAYLQSVGPEGIETTLLENILITEPRANTATIVNKVTESLKTKNIDITKMVGIGTDGASVMTGRKNGVVVKLKEMAPSLIGVHCAAHRCSLASSQAA